MKRLLIAHFFLITKLLSMEIDQPSIEQRIGQLFVISIPLNTLHIEAYCNIINKYHIGGVLLDRRGNLQQQAAVVNTLTQRCQIPPLILEDLEWGLTMRLNDGLRFPRALTCGAIQDNNLIYQMAKEIGRECKLIGVDINLAPVVDINTNPANPVIGDRSFGANKENVTCKGLAYISGLTKRHILACAKHFPGHGDTAIDSHLDLPVITHSKSRLESTEFYPFHKAIQHGGPCMRPAHIYIPSLDKDAKCATLSNKIITEILRNNLKFNGIIITDALRMNALTNYLNTTEIILGAFNAGNDILVCPANITEAINALKKAAQEGTISIEELNKRYKKISELKQKLNLLEKKVEPRNLYEQIHTQKALELKKTLFESTVTLVKNEGTVPLKLDNNTTFIQIGGQSQSMFYKKITEKYNLPNNHLSCTTSGQEISELVADLENYNTIIVGLFEIQKTDQATFGIAPTTQALIKQLQREGKKIILTIFGTPYCLKLFEDIPTIIMAYEDDPDAQEAAAKIINGELKPKGKLPVSISEKFPEGLGL